MNFDKTTVRRNDATYING